MKLLKNLKRMLLSYTMPLYQVIRSTKGFDWDQGNLEKNLQKNGVEKGEIEEVFFNQPLLVFTDNKHSTEESRWYCLGKTNNHKQLFVCFTLREQLVRVISARKMSKKEKEKYENA